MPSSLLVLIGLLALGFTLSFLLSMRVKWKESKYQKISNVSANDFVQHQAGAQFANSYQNPIGTQYALPPPQKVVTYMVMDGRLLDEQ